MAELKPAGWRVTASPLSRLRRLGQRAHKGIRAKYWFPHIPLSLAVALAGLFLLATKFGAEWHILLARFPRDMFGFPPSSMPFLLIGLALLLMPIGLLFRSRFAWIVAVVLTVAAILILLLFPRGVQPLLVYYIGILLFLLLLSHRAFGRSSLAAGTLFAITSSLMLLIYAVFGSLYLGQEFSPPIKDLASAFYYSIVTMSTVGYGDIVPKSMHARFFTVSIILLGIGVFATSISAIIGPVVTRSIDEIVRGREKRMKRANHFIIVGATPLAFNTYRELKKRNQAVTLILAQPPTESGFEDADIVVGDANDLEVLGKAGAQQAQAVLAMRADDSENAFIALAVKELKGKAKTIVAVNDSKHFERVRLAQPDFIIAPQVLGGEMLAMVLSGETITSEFVTDRFLHANPQTSSKPSSS
ncbi:MAG TPA: voltage-gated potassium channel protein [Patescibacteria group bacterium]|nr:voltage-gated potassium channel protein [Patescibacteria group bacterium]